MGQIVKGVKPGASPQYNEVHPIKIDLDDDDIADSQNMQVVICLQYVYDVANSKWVRKPL